MKIDLCLILSAGLGTRMGPIGEILPKPLWPLFEKKILELQISFAKSLGAKKIYINGHHCFDLLKNFVESLKDSIEIKLLHEPTLLGTGGGVHNLAKNENYQGTLLYLAGDQFYFFDKKLFKEAKDLLSENASVLFGLKVKENNLYNRLIIENHRLKSIEKPNSISNITFSGMALIELEKLRPLNGVSSFFDTVANFQEQKIYVLTPDKFEYWDFGSSKNYFDSCFKLLEENSGSFLEFCKKEKVFDLKLLSKGSYGPGKGKNLINLAKKKVENIKNNKAIVINSNKDLLRIDFPGIYFNEISERFLC